MIKSGRKIVSLLLMLTMLLVFVGCGGNNEKGNTSDQGDQPKEKYKVYLNLSYSGNAWQSEGANVIKAMAKTPPYDEMVELIEVISGADVQKQISDIQSMAAAGADAIICYPISPTALNSAIEQVSKQGVLFFNYDSTVTAPSAYNVSYITAGQGQNCGQYLVNCLGGKGNVFVSRGVAGTTVDLMQYNGCMSVFSKYPGIRVVEEYYSNWDDVLTKQNTSKALAAHPKVDGIYAQAGEHGAIQALLEAGHPLVPLVGENSNGFRLALANEEYRAQGFDGVSGGAPPVSGAYAFKLMMELLTGQVDSLPHNIESPLPFVTADAVKINTQPNWDQGGNCFTSDLVPDSFVSEVYDPLLTPEVDLYSALNGTPVKGAKIQKIPNELIKEAPEVPGINVPGNIPPIGDPIYAINEDLVKPIPVP